VKWKRLLSLAIPAKLFLKRSQYVELAEAIRELQDNVLADVEYAAGDTVRGTKDKNTLKLSGGGPALANIPDNVTLVVSGGKLAVIDASSATVGKYFGKKQDGTFGFDYVRLV